jgi:hypothetical protein
VPKLRVRDVFTPKAKEVQPPSPWGCARGPCASLRHPSAAGSSLR